MDFIKAIARLFAFIISFNSFSQNSFYCYDKPDSIDGQKILLRVDKKPDYVGGLQQYYRLVGERISASDFNELSGSLYVQFVVDTLGNVRYECLASRKSFGELSKLEDQALRAVKELNDWIPGEHNGKKVPVVMILPIRLPRN